MRSDGGSPLSDPLLSALVEVMPLWDALQISKREPSLGVTLARRNPMFTQSPEAWQGRPDAQRELFAAVAGTGLSRDLQRGLVVAMLEAGSDAVAIEAVLAFGANAAQTVLSWLDMSDLSSPGDLLDGWRRALRDQTTVLLEWLEASASARESSVALIADLLDPRDAEVKARGAGLWLRPCRPSEVSLPKAAATSFRAFELALGLANAGSGSDELAVRSFEDVHKALRSDEVPYRAWLWDRGTRSHLGVVEKLGQVRTSPPGPDSQLCRPQLARRAVRPVWPQRGDSPRTPRLMSRDQEGELHPREG